MSALWIDPVAALHESSVTTGGGAIGVGDLELGEQAEFVAVVASVLAGVPSESPAIPTVSEDSAEGVRADSQQVGDVVGVGNDPFAIAGPAGREQRIGDLGAVDEHLVAPSDVTYRRADATGAAMSNSVRSNGEATVHDCLGRRRA